jgi:hypothetical protein
MSTEILTAEAQRADAEKIEKIKTSLSNIVNKKSKFLFVVPESQSPVASIYEIYFHATVVKNMGYEVLILVEKGDYVIPTWIEKELTQFKHVAMSDPKLLVGPEDIMVIPEVFSNVMEQTKNLPCLRIGLLQSIDYMMNSLIPGTDWRSFNVSDIITTSETLKEWLETFQGRNKFNIKTYDVGIPSYFEKGDVPQKPIISVVGRNPNEISKLVKLFFSRFPQYSWITFDPMLTKSKPPQQMRRVDFAKRLQGNFAAVWVDRIASFGTFPLECMKSGVIPICLKPDIIPEYIIERASGDTGPVIKISEGAGIWTDSFYNLPILVGEVLVKFLDDGISPDLYSSMEKIAEKYTQENAENQLIKIYQEFIDKRIALFEGALTPPAPATSPIDPEVQKNNLTL